MANHASHSSHGSRSPFARLDILGPDTWALVCTPLGGDRTTFANGGIIAGNADVTAVEGFYRPAGVEWLAQRAKAPTAWFKQLPAIP